MRKSGPLGLPSAAGNGEIPVTLADFDADILLPPAALLDAGVAKFIEMAKLNWPSQDKEGYKSISFDPRDKVMLRVTIGLVYMAMRDREGEA